MSVDPLTRKYPWYTPYQFAGNKPIAAADLDGLEEWMRTQGNLMRDNAMMKVAEDRLKYLLSIPTLSATPYRDQVQQNQQEQYRIQRYQEVGRNDDGSKSPIMQLQENKTFKNFAENLALPLLEGYSYVDGAGEFKAVLETGFSKMQTFYRAMSNEEFAAFSKSGMLPVGGEKFVSTRLAYSKSYLGKPGYDVLVQLNTKDGTLEKLAGIGVRNGSNEVKLSGFGDLPKVTKGWMPTNAFFKGEGATLNIGLGNGKALEEFNNSIINFNVIRP